MEADSLSSDFATRCRADDVTMVVTTSVSFEPARVIRFGRSTRRVGIAACMSRLGKIADSDIHAVSYQNRGVGNRSEPPCEAQLFASGCKHNRTYLCDASSLRKNIC